MHLAITRINKLFSETKVTNVVMLGSKDNTSIRYNIAGPGSSQALTLPEHRNNIQINATMKF
jgi:phosphotransferase system HPr-like phosphotransfer protein